MKEIRFESNRPIGPDGRDTVELPINGDIYFAYRPSTNSIALFYAAQGKKNIASALSGVLEFLEKNLEPEAYALIFKAVRDDMLDFAELLQLSTEIIVEFAENPPTSSAGSSSSRANTGSRSTGNSQRPASRRVSSPSRASSTSSTGSSRGT